MEISRTQYLQSKMKKERVALDQMIKQSGPSKSELEEKKLFCDKGSVSRSRVSCPPYPLNTPTNFVSSKVMPSMLSEKSNSEVSSAQEKTSASIAAFEEVLSASFSTTAIKPRIAPFPNFYERK